MITLEACIEALKNDITDEAPFGEQIQRDNSDYRAVREKIMSISPGYSRPTGDVEDPEKICDEILEHCVNLLDSVSKDIMVINYMGGAILYKFGVPGFSSFLDVYNEMVETNFGELFPKKPKFQANSYGWLGMFLEYYLALKAEELADHAADLSEEDVEPWGKLPDQLQTLCENVLEEIDVNIDLDKKFLDIATYAENFPALAKSKLKKQAPPPKPPKESVQEAKPETQPVEKPKNEPKPTSSESPAESIPKTAVAESPPTPSLELPDADQAGEETRRAIIQQMLEYARYLRAVDETDPLAYQLVRVLIWGEINSPPAVRQARSGEKDVMETMLSLPPIITTIKPLLEKKENGEIKDLRPLLMNLESQVVRPKMAFWLDLQRVIYEILGELELTDIQTVVGVETAGFIRRIGERFLELKFSDGTPFADEKTVHWIRSLTGGKASRPAMTRRAPTPVSRSATPIASSSLPVIPQNSDSPEEILGSLSEADNPLERWNFVRLYGQYLATDPDRLPLALAILESCRRVAVETPMKEMLPRSFQEMMVMIRGIQVSLSGGYGALELSQSYSDYVHEALWLDPLRFLEMEAG